LELVWQQNKQIIMLKKLLIGTAICFGMIGFIQSTTAQTMTKEELTLMKSQMKDSLNSANYLARQAKLAELLSKPPATCGVESIDGAATNSKKMIEEQQKTNDLLKTYVGQLTSDENGQTTQQAGNKVSAADILQLSTSVAKQLLAVNDALTKVTGAAGDVAKASPLKAGAAKKSLSYSKDALGGLGTQLKTQSGILKQMQTYSQAVKNM
jgi:hypothetical protein